MTEWVTVVPGGDAGQVARDLLSLADSPHEVRTCTDDGLTFLVPSTVAEAYAQLSVEITIPDADPGVPDSSGTRAAPRRRGRPRKDA